jgi:hypothetical protein
MYRIELSQGEETVFRSVEELATAIRNGLVTSRARIYHSASQKWLPIEFHPHYKKALDLPPRKAIEVATGSTGRTIVATPPVAASPAPLAPEPAPVRKAAAARLDPEPIFYPEITPAEAPVAHAFPARARSMRRQVRHLAVAAGVIAACSYLVVLASTPSSRAAEEEPVPAPDPAPLPPNRGEVRPASVPAAAHDVPAPAATQISRPERSALLPAIVPPVTAGSTPVRAEDAAPSVEPPPAEVDLSLPSPIPAESLTSVPQSVKDSSAISRILDAVGARRTSGPRAVAK